MKNRSTVFLRLALAAMSLVIVGLCALILPSIFKGWPTEYPQMASLKYPFVIGIGLTLIPFLTAVYQAFKLLNYIDKNTVFSAPSVAALRNIKYSALAIAAIYTAGLFIAYQVAQAEDAPGLILMWSAILIGIPLVISVFSALMQQLVAKVIEIKSENDLTV